VVSEKDRMKNMRKNKVVELNIEYGNPDVPTALARMKNGLMTYKRLGKKAVIVIHGYGSTGAGGSIRSAARSSLGENSMRGIVREYVPGEQWLSKKNRIMSICASVSDYEKSICGNPGVTLVILR
jgi:hypothetical protein